eukprot:245595_1
MGLMDKKYNGDHGHGETHNLIKFIDSMYIKVVPREGFNSTEDIPIYLYATKGTIAKMTHLLHQNHQRNLSLIFWSCSTWSSPTLTICLTSQTTTRSFGDVDIHTLGNLEKMVQMEFLYVILQKDM